MRHGGVVRRHIGTICVLMTVRQTVSCVDFLPRTKAHSHNQSSAARTSHAHERFAKILIAHARVCLCVCFLPKFANAPSSNHQNLLFENKLLKHIGDRKTSQNALKNSFAFYLESSLCSLLLDRIVCK